jgi:hypothetical protein
MQGKSIIGLWHLISSPGIGQSRVNSRRDLEPPRIFRPTGTTWLRLIQPKTMKMLSKIKKLLRIESTLSQDKVVQQLNSKTPKRKCLKL